MPKPSVALWSAKPTISTVANPISPARADTPIARPSAKLWRPIAAAIVMPVRSAAALAADASAATRETAAEQQREPGRVPEALLVVVELRHRLLDDLEAMRDQVHEDEREHADGEHRERHPRAGVEDLKPA